MTIDAAIAVVRFGLGAKPGEIRAVSKSPKQWLERQIKPQAAKLSSARGMTSQQAIGILRKARLGKKADKEAARQARDTARKTFRKTLLDEAIAIHQHAQETAAPFAERWVNFWANHFTVSANQLNTLALTGPYLREAIRPHVFGRFDVLLTAATLHPAMLAYLDNHISFGPNSRIGKRRGRDINENLAREVLELHTLGVDGGYRQHDVEAFALALSGWQPGFISAAFKTGSTAATQFISAFHEPGPKSLLGKRYAQDGESQAKAILSDLAVHPSTARHVAFKLARHFIADEPPKEAVAALAKSFEDSNGDLSRLALTLVQLDAAWERRLKKAKTPYELIISASRVLGAEPVLRHARKAYTALAQPLLRAPSPAGWPDVSDAWLSPDAVKKRLEWSNLLAQRSTVSGDAFLQTALGDLADDALRLAITRAQSQSQAITLALMSPAFQRR